MDESSYTTGGHNFSDFHLSGNSRAHIGDVHGGIHHHGMSNEERAINAFLQSIYFPDMGARAEAVAEAEGGTFEWMLENENARGLRDQAHPFDAIFSHGPWRCTQDPLKVYGKIHDERSRKVSAGGKLRAWLSNEEGDPFWISGLPGSGKSTLMKFLRSHEYTQTLLQDWASGCDLMVVDHFFWLAGAPLANSIDGMLRALLYKGCWLLLRDTNHTRLLIASHVLPVGSVTQSRKTLMASLRHLCSISRLKWVFWVDGLDECQPERDHGPLVEFLNELGKLSSVKLIVSSRPWLTFEDTLREAPAILMQDLTLEDHLLYLRTKLLNSSLYGKSFSDLRTDSQLEAFIMRVALRAEGVFLWTKLVACDLQNQIRKGKSLEDLNETLESTPRELIPYIQRYIYDRIHKSSGNECDTASALKLALLLSQSPENRLRGRSNLSPMAIHYWLLRRGSLASGKLEPSEFKTDRYTHEEERHRLEQVKSFLAETTGDLMILRPHENIYGSGSNVESLISPVSFLHRSVLDYVTSDHFQAFLDRHTPSHFHEPLFSKKVFLLGLIVQIHNDTNSCREIRDLNREIVSLAQDAAIDTQTQMMILKNCEDFALARLWERCTCNGYDHAIGDWLPQNAVEEQVANIQKKKPSTSGLTWLLVGVQVEHTKKRCITEVDITFLETLLSFGSNPNVLVVTDPVSRLPTSSKHYWTSLTVWEAFLRKWREKIRTIRAKAKHHSVATETSQDLTVTCEVAVKIAMLLIQHGASTSVCLEQNLAERPCTTHFWEEVATHRHCDCESECTRGPAQEIIEELMSGSGVEFKFPDLRFDSNSHARGTLEYRQLLLSARSLRLSQLRSVRYGTFEGGALPRVFIERLLDSVAPLCRYSEFHGFSTPLRHQKGVSERFKICTGCNGISPVCVMCPGNAPASHEGHEKSLVIWFTKYVNSNMFYYEVARHLQKCFDEDAAEFGIADPFVADAQTGHLILTRPFKEREWESYR
ncbi:hypothetical protein Q7P37_010932 [Cladosporium fusiforme]